MASVAGGLALSVGCARGQELSDDPPPTPDDWPEWSPPPRTLYDRVETLRRSAVSLADHGLRNGGDIAGPMEQAIRAGARAIAIPAGSFTMSRQIVFHRPLAILGDAGGSLIEWRGTENSALRAEPATRSPDDFVRDIALDRVEIRRPDNSKAGGWLLSCANVRGLTVTRCSAHRVSLVRVEHMRQALNLYDRRKGSIEQDPAVLAGFAAGHVDDLCEDVAIIGNRVDYGEYQGAIARFDFTRRVAVYRNIGRFAKVSWWGGGARIKEGGDIRHQRRVQHVYVAENTLSGANGGVYGNNGRYCVVARNVISDMLDVGVDFEGCMDCTAYENRVKNAGNFAYATFYAARNIEFRDNYGEQDGSAATLNERYGTGKYGSQRGIYLAALRSSGFTKADDAIIVRFIGNRFVYSGKGKLGACAPSFFTELEFRDNEMVNVCCDWRYRRTDRVRITGNRLSFDQSGDVPVTLCAASGYDGTIADNRITVAADLPAESVGIGYQLMTRSSQCVIAGNIIDNRGSTPLPITVAAVPAFTGTAAITGNRVEAVLTDGLAGRLQQSRNLDRGGRMLTPGRSDRIPGYPIDS